MQLYETMNELPINMFSLIINLKSLYYCITYSALLEEIKNKFKRKNPIFDRIIYVLITNHHNLSKHILIT